MFSYAVFERLCTEHNVSPSQVSKETGVATATLSSWKNGKYIPKIEKIQLLANYFNVSIDEFIAD